METGTLIRTPQLEDVTELIQRIQSLLKLKEAARTCVLSKSWLHAWSTIPFLKFISKPKLNATEEEVTKYVESIERTLQRYHQDSIPIQTFNLIVDIWDKKMVSLAEKWIPLVAPKSCLKNLSLIIWLKSGSDKLPDEIFYLPDEVFSGENVKRIHVWADGGIVRNPVIKCVSLLVLHLKYLNISDEVLDNLLSTCILLKNIYLSSCKGLKTIKVKKLFFLTELKIKSTKTEILEIDDVPSLRLFHYGPPYQLLNNPLPFNTDSLGCVTHLKIDYVRMDDAFFAMVKLKFPFLESLTLGIGFKGMESLVIKNDTVKNLTLIQSLTLSINVKVHVYAPKLVFFCFSGITIPSLLFPIIVPGRIKLGLPFRRPINQSFLLEIREFALNFPSKIDIEIEHGGKHSIVPINTNIDGLRRLISFPVTNVQQLSLTTFSDEHVWNVTRFFDTFFSICHPKYVRATRHSSSDNKCFFKLMVTGIMEKKASDLKDVELKNHVNSKWEVITSSWRSVLDRLVDQSFVEFKLSWLSP